MSAELNQENVNRHAPASQHEAPPPSAGISTAHATIRTATCAQMVRSKLNVRRKGADNLAELMALIRSQGLLHNLVGFGQLDGGRATGIVEVVAGGRRLACIGRLIEQGELPRDYQIPYLLVTQEEGVAISLAENMGREAMHPADVFDAMLELSRRGVSVDDIAVSFGVDGMTVRRRLKLANVSPRLVALYRADQISFDQMVALGVSDDHVAQERAWDGLDAWSRQPHQLRRLLTAQHIDVRTDRVARFVGVAAFEKAGGAVTRDLFSDSGAGYISDAALLDSLAAAKLGRAAATLNRQGHAWVEVRARLDQSELAAYARVRHLRRPTTEEEKAALEALAAELEQLDTGIDVADADDGDGDGEGEGAVLVQRRRELEARRRALEHALAVPHAADKALAGALVTLDEQGKMVIHCDLIRPGDRSKMALIADAGEGDARPRGKAPHSERLTRILTVHRTVALQARVMERADIALVVLTHALVKKVFYPRGRTEQIARLGLEQAVLPEEAAAGPAATAVKERRGQLQARLPQQDDGRSLLAWLLAQPQATVMELTAFCVACSLDAMQEREQPSPAFAELARAAGLNMGDWWAATAASYFSHVSKARILEVVSEAVSQQAAVPLEKMPKAAAADAAERAVAGSGWLPAVLRPE